MVKKNYFVMFRCHTKIWEKILKGKNKGKC